MTRPRDHRHADFGWQLLGVTLFLFIPVVLFLFVRRPEPVGASLIAGLVLMLGHRFLARPYMARIRARKCLWSNAMLARSQGAVMPETTLQLATAGGPVATRCRPEHQLAARRFFGALDRWRVPLRLAIFVPLAFLLVTAGMAAFGRPAPTVLATALFQVIVGASVGAVAVFYRWVPPAEEPLPVPFPAHNFFLLGIRTLLWVFRIVGALWVIVGLRTLFPG